MSVLNYPQLISSFPNNVIGLVVPINMRDFVDSVERKYDNWNVVKPGNIEGNKFPDAAAGKITLPDNGIWVINGVVTVNYPIYYGDKTNIIGLSGSYISDQILLDASAGAVALINSDDVSYTFSAKNVGLGSIGGTGTLFDIQEPALAVFSGCLFAFNAGGTIDFLGATGDVYFVDRCLSFFNGTPIQFTGSGGNLIFDGVRSGLSNGDVQFDLQGTFGGVFISRCFHDAAFAMFKILTDSVADAGSVDGNIVKNNNPFIEGIDETSITFTFSNNAGISNTSVGASILMYAGVFGTNITTLNSGWTDLIGNAQDTIGSLACRFERSNPLSLTYLGKQISRVNASASVIGTGSGVDYNGIDIAFFVNGEIVSQPFQASVTSITRVGTLASATLAAPFDGLWDGAIVTISGASPAQYNGTFVISNVTGFCDTFDYTMASDPGASATGTLLANLPVSVVLSTASAADPVSFTINAEINLSENDEVSLMVRSKFGATTPVAQLVLDRFSMNLIGSQ